jgi:hypothetical protein
MPPQPEPVTQLSDERARRAERARPVLEDSTAEQLSDPQANALTQAQLAATREPTETGALVVVSADIAISPEGLYQDVEDANAAVVLDAPAGYRCLGSYFPADVFSVTEEELSLDAIVVKMSFERLRTHVWRDNESFDQAVMRLQSWQERSQRNRKDAKYFARSLIARSLIDLYNYDRAAQASRYNERPAPIRPDVIPKDVGKHRIIDYVPKLITWDESVPTDVTDTLARFTIESPDYDYLRHAEYGSGAKNVQQVVVYAYYGLAFGTWVVEVCRWET